MRDFQALLPPSKSAKTAKPSFTMEDVRASVGTSNYLKQSLRTLQSHLGGMPLSLVPGTEDWFIETFPKPKGGIHPRPDLKQKIEPYMKWRQEVLRAIRLANGEAEAKKKRSYQDDSWKKLLDAIKLHSSGGGIIYKSAGGPVSSLADLCRTAGIETWDLDSETALKRIEDAIAAHRSADRPVFRSALAFLEKHRFIDELQEALPKGPIVQLPTKAQKMELPEAIELCIEELCQRAATAHDEVVDRYKLAVGENRLNDYRAALRHHFRSLPRCLPEPDMGYIPIEDLTSINDPMGLLGIEHLKATIRRTEAAQKDPDGINAVSAHKYYGDIKVILERTGNITPAEIRILESSSFLKSGARESGEMTPKVKQWCKALLADPQRQEKFATLHIKAMEAANEMMAEIKARGAYPSSQEIADIRRFGIVAVAACIEFAGAPLRRANLVQLRISGPSRNLIWDGKKKEYCFSIAAEETKAKKTIETTYVRKEFRATEVIDWYLEKIRPLFYDHDRSIYLLPGIEDGSKHLDKKYFGDMFQKTATQLGLPMNFHNWRHGYVSIILNKDWSMLPFVAKALGHTEHVCSQKYAFVNNEADIKKGQDKLVEIFKAGFRS